MSDYTSVNIYESYCEDIENPLSKDVWQDLCVEFNTRVMDEIIYKGREFNMGERLSTISVIKVDRDFSKPRTCTSTFSIYRIYGLKISMEGFPVALHLK